MAFVSSPPIAFLIYILLVCILVGIGRILAGPSQPTLTKSSPYASGEAPRSTHGTPGYRPFFQTALFFAILHLGALVLASGGVSWVSAVYLLGLILVLVALILG